MTNFLQNYLPVYFTAFFIPASRINEKLAGIYAMFAANS
jgi:hypothetical protein